MGFWKEQSIRVIRKALAEAEAKGLDAKATEKYVSDAYPFNARLNSPYKSWLTTMAELVPSRKKKRTARTESAKAADDATNGQGRFF